MISSLQAEGRSFTALRDMCAVTAGALRSGYVSVVIFEENRHIFTEEAQRDLVFIAAANVHEAPEKREVTFFRYDDADSGSVRAGIKSALLKACPGASCGACYPVVVPDGLTLGLICTLHNGEKEGYETEAEQVLPRAARICAELIELDMRRRA